MTPISESAAADRIVGLLEQGPTSFYAILRSLRDVEYRDILAAWGALREKNLLARDEHGNYLLAAKRDEAR